MKRRLDTVLLGTGVLLALAFGATQAAAKPDTKAKRGEFCFTAQERAECNLACAEDGLWGICDPDIGCYCI